MKKVEIEGKIYEKTVHKVEISNVKFTLASGFEFDIKIADSTTVENAHVKIQHDDWSHNDCLSWKGKREYTPFAQTLFNSTSVDNRDYFGYASKCECVDGVLKVEWAWSYSRYDMRTLTYEIGHKFGRLEELDRC